MQQLEALTREAVALASGALPAAPLSGPESEVARQMQICNACRYCEGFCAVFPAMTRHLEFGKADIHYLANLCHNCGACYHACQYAPPHEFAINVPQAMAKVRVQTYADYAWPPALGALYQRQGLMISLALAAALALFLVLAVGVNGTLAGNFYAIFPHNLMVQMFAPIFLFAVLALTLGVLRFWRDVSPAKASEALGEAAVEATSAALRLKYLDGANLTSADEPAEGCPNGDDAPTLWRRRFHHLTFYGFMLCFASTSVATLYHYLFNWQAPYGYTSLPVILGTVGGMGLLIGPAGLLWLNLRRHAASHGDAAQKPMDRGFIALLFLISLTGLALLVWRDSAAMAVLLAVHLGTVMAFFVTLPYGKFAHGVFRSAALLKFAIEKRQPTQLALPEA